MGRKARNDAGLQLLDVDAVGNATSLRNLSCNPLATRNLRAVTAQTRPNEDRFVKFGPEEARKAREAAGLPEPTEAPPDASALRRWWTRLTRGNGDGRKLWASRPRDDNE